MELKTFTLDELFNFSDLDQEDKDKIIKAFYYFGYRINSSEVSSLVNLLDVVETFNAGSLEFKQFMTWTELNKILSRDECEDILMKYFNGAEDPRVRDQWNGLRGDKWISESDEDYPGYHTAQQMLDSYFPNRTSKWFFTDVYWWKSSHDYFSINVITPKIKRQIFNSIKECLPDIYKHFQVKEEKKKTL